MSEKLHPHTDSDEHIPTPVFKEEVKRRSKTFVAKWVSVAGIGSLAACILAWPIVSPGLHYCVRWVNSPSEIDEATNRMNQAIGEATNKINRVETHLDYVDQRQITNMLMWERIETQIGDMQESQKYQRQQLDRIETQLKQQLP